MQIPEIGMMTLDYLEIEARKPIGSLRGGCRGPKVDLVMCKYLGRSHTIPGVSGACNRRDDPGLS